MRIDSIQNNNYSFKGYDAIKLKGFYMQGLVIPAEQRIYKEMAKIAQAENLDIFVNSNNTGITRFLLEKFIPDSNLSIWAQDRKAFVRNAFGNIVLCNSREDGLNADFLKGFNHYRVNTAKYMPRGGDYYIGFNGNGDKWLLINNMAVSSEKSYNGGELPTKEQLYELFDVKPENVYLMNEFVRDLDEVVRPVGYPYILVNDYQESMNNIERLRKDFPKSFALRKLAKYCKEELTSVMNKSYEDRARLLKSFGFIPIKIGGHYSEGINFINALAFKNDSGKISYITNSTKNSLPELECLEKIFEKDLREKIPEIDRVHFVSGGQKPKAPEPKNRFDGWCIKLFSSGFKEDNAIMDILTNRHGGIHCMTAEIPY